MSTRPFEFADFLEQLRGKTVGIVYSFSNKVDPSEAWYDRWRSDVVYFFGKGVEALGAEPRYMDVESYLRVQSYSEDSPGDYVINLHSGLNDLGCWPIISSLARWRRIPVAPCSSDVHIAGERKDIANMIASGTGMRVPEVFDEQAADETLFVRKPRDLGMSRGLRSFCRSELSPNTFGNDIVQRLIKGYDATVGLLRMPSGQFEVVGAEVLIPHERSNSHWLYSEESKIAEGKTSVPFDRRNVDVSSRLRELIYETCSRIGPSGHYRLDFRVESSNPDEIASLTSENAYFLEANPTPTVSINGEFGGMVADWMSKGGLRSQIDHESAEHLEGLGKEAVLVAFDLHSALLDITDHARAANAI